MRGKKEEIERNKTPKPIGRIRVGFGRKRRRKTAARRLARRRPEVGDDPDMWAPHVSGWRRRGRAASAGLAWAGSAARREREYWAEIGPIT